MTKDKIYDFGILGKFSRTTLIELKQVRRRIYPKCITLYIEYIEYSVFVGNSDKLRQIIKDIYEDGKENEIL
jgi:uncharacterized protein YqfB (UPF0267 family)